MFQFYPKLIKEEWGGCCWEGKIGRKKLYHFMIIEGILRILWFLFFKSQPLNSQGSEKSLTSLQ